MSEAILNIVVIGTGMYSTGRGTDSFGTVLPAIIEWKRSFKNKVGEVIFVGTNGSNSKLSKRKIDNIIKQTNVKINIKVLPVDASINTETYKEVIEAIPKPACAIIAVPDHLHFKISSDCIDAGLNILIVKPLAPTVNECLMLCDKVKDKGVYASVEFHKRFDVVNLMMRDRIIREDLGDILYSLVEYSQRKSIPTKIFKKWVTKTSILQYLGIHYIDIMQFITKASPVRVMATGQKKWLLSRGLDAYDSIQCMVEWQQSNGSKFIQSILTNWIDPESSTAMSDQKIKIIGTKGRFESDQKERGVKINIDDKDVEEPNPYFCTSYKNSDNEVLWSGYGIESINTFLTDVHDLCNGRASIAELEKKRPNFLEATISTAVVSAAHESLNNKSKWIEIEQYDKRKK